MKKNPFRIVLTELSRTSRFDSKKLSVIILVVTITIIVDSSTGYVADFIPEQLTSSSGIGAFIGIVIISAIAQYFILSYVKEINLKTRAMILHLHSIQMIVSLAQYVLVGILVVVILQILAVHQYNLVTLYSSYAISYGLWIVMFALLTRAFFIGTNHLIRT